MLRRFDIGENDRRVVMLTAERGKIDAIARGARKPASRLRAAVEPLSLVKVSLAESKNRYITHVTPIDALKGLREDYDRLGASLALVDLLDRVCPYERPEPAVFRTAVAALATMEHSQSPLPPLVWAMAKVLVFEGQAPDWSLRGVDRELEGHDLITGPLSREVRIALTRITELNDPPDHLKRQGDCVRAVGAYWEVAGEMRFGALRALLEAL